MRALSKHLILLLVVARAVLPADAAEPRWPTQQEIDAARAARPVPRIEQSARDPVAPLPAIKPAQPAIDVESIARRYAENRQAFSASTTGPSLMIFVTLAMPEASLKQLANQAARSGATIIIRGLKDDSMKKTLAAVQRVIGNHPVAWQIDPPAFARFNVRHAPTFVVTAASITTASCLNGCAPDGAFASVAGDVSLDYALEFIGRTRPAFAGVAQAYLKRLRG